MLCFVVLYVRFCAICVVIICVSFAISQVRECLLSFGAGSSVFQFAIQNTKIKTYRTIILPVLFYGYQTWSLTVREEHRLWVFENRVLRRICGPKRDEVTVEWKILHNEELNDLYSSPNIIRVIKSRRIRWARQVARMGEGRGAYRILAGRPEGRRPLERPRRRWEDNIKMDLQEVGWGHGLD
jgi:hypothetical protein